MYRVECLSRKWNKVSRSYWNRNVNTFFSGYHKSKHKAWVSTFYFVNMPSTTLSIYERFTCRAYSSSFMHAIVAHMRFPFFKVFSNFVHFCPNFQMFCPFCPFFRPWLDMNWFGFANFYHYQKTNKKFCNLNEQCFFPSM